MKSNNWLSRFFKLFIKAIINCWDQLWKSFVILVAITIILATLFYFYESPVQPEYSNWWKDLVWAFSVYIGDPGGFGGAGPVTFAGKIIITALSIVNILIFAIPAGIIASGLTTALEEDSHQKKIQKNYMTLQKAFLPSRCRHTMLRRVPTYKSMASLQVKYGLKVDDIIDAINFDPRSGLRLRNLGDSYTQDENATDKFVVEMFPTAHARDYGTYINRNSPVTVVCTSSYDNESIGDSHFGYLLAELGGFNFVSREYDDGSGSFYIVPDETSEGYSHFFTDIKHLASGKDKWIILINQFPRRLKAQLCFVNEKKIDGKVTPTVIDTTKFDTAYSEIVDTLEKHTYQVNVAEEDNDKANTIHADLNTCFKRAGKRNLAVLLGGGEECNAFTMRIASSLACRDRRDVSLTMKMAEIMRRNFIGDDTYQVDNLARWKNEGIKY